MTTHLTSRPVPTDRARRLPGTATALRIDAAGSGALGLALAATSPLAEEWFGVPLGLALGVGAFLLAWAGFCLWVAREPRAALVREVTLLNLGWIAASIGFLLVDPVGLTTLGDVLVVAQTVAVGGFVTLTTAAMRSPAPSIGA